MKASPRLGALVAVGAILLAACGSDSKSSSTTAPAAAPTTAAAATTTAASTATTGGTTATTAGGSDTTAATASKAFDPSLPPITVGFHNLEGGSYSLPDLRAGFEAGLKYVNTELGGINGHELK